MFFPFKFDIGELFIKIKNIKISNQLQKVKELKPNPSFSIKFYSVLGLLIVFLVTSIFLCVSLLGSKKVYSGVYLDGIHMAGFTEEKLEEYLASTYDYDLDKLTISVYHKDYPKKVTFSDLDVKVDLDKTRQDVYGAGRNDNIFKRLINIYRYQKNHLYLYTDVSFSKDKISSLIDEIYKNTYISSKSPNLLILDEVILCSGTYGYSVNRVLLEERLYEQIKSLRSGIVIVPVQETPPPKIDADVYYNQIVRQAHDARPEATEDNQVVIHPHEIGMKLDKSKFLTYVARMESRESKAYLEQTLPVEIVVPDITTNEATQMLFKDYLGTYMTKFPHKTPNDINRAINIKLAVEEINGTIIGPGEEFSFNDILGKRTWDKGYRVANVYYDGKITDAIGGGICQVSTTLYNAALYANLKIIERHNHTFKVGYVAAGRDASVAYGVNDLVFLNDTIWPIRIDGKVTNNTVSFTIVGTNFHPDIAIEILTALKEETPYKTVYIDDPNMPSGTEETVHEGVNGAVVDTIKIVKSAGKPVSEYTLHQSTYLPLDTQIIKGVD